MRGIAKVVIAGFIVLAVIIVVALLINTALHGSSAQSGSEATTAPTPSAWPPGSRQIPDLTWSKIASLPHLRSGESVIDTPPFRTSGGVIRVTGRVQPWDPTTQENMQIDLVPAASRTDNNGVDYHEIDMSPPVHGTWAFDAWTDNAARPGRYRLAIWSENADLSLQVFEGR